METGSTFLILAAEGIAVLLAIIGLAGYWLFRQTKMDKSALADFVNQIKRDETQRSEALHSTFSDTYRYEGEELTEAVGEVVQKERDIYRALVSIYQNKDRNRILKFADTVETLVKLSLDLVPKTKDAAYEQELTVLREERDRLVLDLEATKQAFTDLMNEYTRAFDKEKLGTAAVTTVTQRVVEQEPDIEVETAPSPVEVSPRQEQMLNTLAQLDVVLEVVESPPAGQIGADDHSSIDIDWDELLAEPSAVGKGSG